MPEPLAPRYNHRAVEKKIYKLWEASGYFNPDRLPPTSYKLKAKSYCIIMPPPNANGALHIGHALVVALQDIMVRFARMRGKRTLWLPGADHAGFETQVVFDKKLEKEGRSRFSMDRERLWEEMWDFTQENKKIMENQLRKLGASCDWSRKKFTLDADIVKGVHGTFLQMHRDGLVYRHLRVVNWCPKHKTALSDLEVKYVEREDPLYYIKYGPLTLATVRPETKFGDTALAVNPKDKRYQKYIGTEIEALGVLGPVRFKIISDEAVDPLFGTGVIKVTPAHDPADFEIWQRHKNEIPGPKVIIDDSGRLTGDVGQFKGLKVAEARQKVADAMQKAGILEKIEPRYVHHVATCYKCGSVLELIPKPQWFVKMSAAPMRIAKSESQRAEKSLRDLGIWAVKSGKIKFTPKRFEKIYLHWLRNIRDWNVSRQIVWGIRIPAWFKTIQKPVHITYFVHGTTTDNEEGKSSGHYDVDLSAKGFRQVQELKDAVKNKKFDAVFSSDLQRAWKTAEGAFEGAKFIRDRRLREVDYGKLTRQSEKKVVPRKKKHIATPFPGGESYKDVEARMRDFLVEVARAYQGKNVAIVSHQAPQLALDVVLEGIMWEEAFDRDWRITRAYQHGWDFTFSQLVHVGNTPPEKEGWIQDPDVFDTWYSSGQWPYLTLGFPDSRDFKTFYPTDVMETGYDILFFWVARMIMFSLYRTGKTPFTNVYLNGMVRDKDKQKMSKSKGNVMDPLGVAEEYGADSLRIALVAGNASGNDPAISEDKIRGYRNFTTKLWNITRFIAMHKPITNHQSPVTNKTGKKHLAELKKLKTAVTKHMEKFEFHLAAEKLYHYVWHTFADKIIEEYKPKLKIGASAGTFEEALGGPASLMSEGLAGPRTQAGARRRSGRTAGSERALAEAQSAYQTLEAILLECLKMLHPFMPFVTEELYQKLKPKKLLMVEPW